MDAYGINHYTSHQESNLAIFSFQWDQRPSDCSSCEVRVSVSEVLSIPVLFLANSILSIATCGEF